MAEQTAGDIAPGKKTEQQVKLMPTLFIGVGGSGMEVLLRVRRRILNAGWGPGGSQRVNDLSEFPVAQFLHFDLAVDEVKEQGVDRQADPLAEVVRLRDEDRLCETFDIEQYSASDGDLDRFPLIKAWSPLSPAKIRELGIDPSKGAGQIRAISRLYFFDKYAKIRDRIRSKLLALKNGLSNRDLFDRLALKPGGEKLRIVVVCSVAGGTGSGSFLDMGFLAKSVASQSVGATDCHLMLMLPTGYSGENKERTEANAYAALMELETCMRGDFRFVEAWHEADPRKIGARPYDEVYLIDSGNTAGQHTGDQKDVYEMVADALFEDFGSEDFATRKRSTAVNQSQFKVLPYEPRVPKGRYGDMKVAFYKGYSAFGQAILDTQQAVRRDILVYRWMGEMLKAFFGVASADARSNRATDKHRDEFLATYFHVMPMAFGDFPDFSAKGVELRLTTGEFVDFALTDDLLSDANGNLVAGVQQKVDAAFEAIQQQFDKDEWAVQVRAAVKHLQRDVVRDQDSAEATEDRVKAQAKVLFQEITKATDAVLYGYLDNREYGGLEYVISLVEQAKDRLENPNTGLVPACELNARRYAEIRDALSTYECERLLGNLGETKGWSILGSSKSQAEKIMGQLRTEVGNFLKFHLRATAAEQAARLLKDLSKWLGNREGVDASGEPVWSGFVGGLQDGRRAVLDLLARIDKTVMQLRDDTKRDHATYICIDSPEVSQSLPPAPKLAEWAKEVFDNYGGSRVLFAMLRSDDDRGKLFSGLRAQALRQLPQSAGTADQDPLLLALEAMGPVARQRKFSELLTRAMPWVHANLDGEFKIKESQYKCFVGVGRSRDFERFKEELVSQVPPGAGIGREQVRFVDTGVPGRAVCYVELSGFPLTILRGLESWRTSYRIEKIPVHTHRDKTRFVHPIVPSTAELERLAEDFQTFLQAVVLGVLFRNPKKDISPPGLYRFEVAPGELVDVGNERGYRMDGLPPYYRSQIVEAVEERVANLSARQCAALAGLYEHYANFTYRAKMVADDGGVQTPRQGFASSMAALLAREFRDKAARKGASVDELDAWVAEAKRSLSKWTVEVDGSDADAYPWEVQPAEDGPPRLKRVVKPDFFAAGWTIPGLSVDPNLPGDGPALPGTVPGSGPPLPPGAPPLPPVVAPTAQYWLFSQNQKWGPYAFAQLKLAFDSGQVARGTLAWRDGLSQWAPIESLAEFAAPVAPGFPPMPPLPPGGGPG
jgi:hypothetical protein